MNARKTLYLIFEIFAIGLIFDAVGWWAILALPPIYLLNLLVIGADE